MVSTTRLMIGAVSSTRGSGPVPPRRGTTVLGYGRVAAETPELGKLLIGQRVHHAANPGLVDAPVHMPRGCQLMYIVDAAAMDESSSRAVHPASLSSDGQTAVIWPRWSPTPVSTSAGSTSW